MLAGLFKSPLFVLGVLLFGLTLVTAIALPWVFHVNVDQRVGLAYMPPSGEHWLGTDHLGLDLVSLHIVGLRSSLYVGLVSGVVATVVGTLSVSTVVTRVGSSTICSPRSPTYSW